MSVERFRCWACHTENPLSMRYCQVCDEPRDESLRRAGLPIPAEPTEDDPAGWRDLPPARPKRASENAFKSLKLLDAELAESDPEDLHRIKTTARRKTAEIDAETGASSFLAPEPLRPLTPSTSLLIVASAIWTALVVGVSARVAAEGFMIVFALTFAAALFAGWRGRLGAPMFAWVGCLVASFIVTELLRLPAPYFALIGALIGGWLGWYSALIRVR